MKHFIPLLFVSIILCWFVPDASAAHASIKVEVPVLQEMIESALTVLRAIAYILAIGGFIYGCFALFTGRIPEALLAILASVLLAATPAIVTWIFEKVL